MADPADGRTPERSPIERNEDDGHPEPAADPPPRCDLCGGAMLERHCRLVCQTCGYQRDCSDP